MERFRRKKFKVPANNEGSQQIHRQRSILNLAADSSSFGSGAVGEYSYVCLDRGSPRRATGMPIKELLAEEMSKESESKRRPSVVAKLMGLDGLPSQQPIPGQHKGFSRTSRQKTTLGVSDIKKLDERHLYMKNSTEKAEFKDVYVVSEASKVSRDNCQAKGYVKPKHSEAEMAFIREKFMDAKRLSTDEKLQNSKEFCHTLEMLDTNKELLIKFLQQPDSLFTKHLLDLQHAAPTSHCRSMPVVKEPTSEYCERKSKKGTSRCNDRLSPNSFTPSGATKNPKSSEIQLCKQHEPETLPTQIVVLKPNLEKLRNSTKSVSSHRKHVKYPFIVTDEAGQSVRKPVSGDAGFSSPNIRGSRETAKEITRRMRKNLGCEPIDLSSKIWGYAGDESSYNVSGSDSGSESDETVLSSRKSFQWSSRQNLASSHSLGSSISMEAKERLSKRWNVSQRHQDVGSVGNSRKLGEVLAKPCREMTRGNLDPVIVLNASPNRVVNDENAGLGINSMDDSKDGYARNFSRLGFVPASSVSRDSPERRMQRKTLNHDRVLLPGEPINQGIKKANVHKREDSSCRNIRSGNRKPQFPFHSSDSADTVEEDQFNLFQDGIKIGEKKPSEEVILVSQMTVGNVNSPSLMTDAEMDLEHEDMALSSESLDEFFVEPSPCHLGINNSSTLRPEVSKRQIEPSEADSVPLQCPEPEIQSLACSKEADHLSPISVLEASFMEDIPSGSECFERVNADLSELRMQLKLLRIESGTYADGANLVSSDKDDGQGSVSDNEEIVKFEEDCWQTSYIVDILKESGFNSTDPNMIIAIWHSLECPIAPWVFDKLEIKYSNETSCSRPERRLLLDRVNCGLVEIFWWLVDPYPWVNTGRKKLSLEWVKNGAKYELDKLLASEEKKASELVEDREMQWLDFGDEIDVIGREIEKLLVDDLIGELATVYAF